MLQGKFNLEVAKRLRTVTLVLALLYLFYAPSHLLVIGGADGFVMAAVALASSALFIGLYRRWGAQRVRPARAHPAAALLVGTVLVNCLAHLYLTTDIEQSTNILLLIVALGSLLLSLRWLLGCVAASILAWGLVVMALPNAATSGVLHYGFALFAASLFSVIIYTVRARMLGDLERTVASLRESEERFQRLADASFEGILVHDRGTILDANERLGAMTGFRPDELVGRHASEFVAGESAAFVLERTSSDEVYSNPAEVVGLRRDGSTLLVELLERPLPYKERTVRVVAVRDLSVYKRTEAALRRSQAELREKNRELEHANRLKSEFLATMSHELRTPLTAVLGFSQLLGDELFGPLNDKQQEQVRGIHDSGAHLLSLISDILDLSKIEADRVSLTRAETDAAALLQGALEVVRPSAEAKGIHLHAQLGSIGSLYCDATRVKQVLYNYLGNAIKFTPIGGEVTLHAREVVGALHVEVADNGIGIAAADLPKLFQPFSQVDSSLSRNYGGTGLGLALSKRLVELHGGEVWVRSEPGEGSCFGFSLPNVAFDLPEDGAFEGEVPADKASDYDETLGAPFVSADDDTRDEKRGEKTSQEASKEVSQGEGLSSRARPRAP